MHIILLTTFSLDVVMYEDCRERYLTEFSSRLYNDESDPMARAFQTLFNERRTELMLAGAVQVAYRWLRRYSGCRGDAFPPPVPHLNRGSRNTGSGCSTCSSFAQEQIRAIMVLLQRIQSKERGKPSRD